MPHDPTLADAMRKALSRRKGISEKRMFGGVCFLLDGNMLCGVETQRLMFRVGKERESRALAMPGARPMAFTGRPMAGFVWVDADAALAAPLKVWIDLAAAYVRTLPPK